MGKRRSSRKPIGKATAEVGDFVLIGECTVTMPNDWWLAQVLWIGPEDVLVEQYGIAFQNTHRQLHPASYIRAVGTPEELFDIQGRCAKEVEALVRAVRTAEDVVHDLRRQVWARLDDFAKAEPMRNAGDI